MTYYNELDPFPAQWLRNLSDAGHIAKGRVDNRSITEVQGWEITENEQAHFFAGIGVWSRALRLAGVPDSFPVWTGSCPCQPFSQAGRRKGFEDDRHLWPEWFRLIKECHPPVVFGEQVASKDGLQWLDAVFVDLEGEGYACAAADTCAAGVGAPHLRQRLYWVAYYVGKRRIRLDTLLQWNKPGWVSENRTEVAGCGEVGRVAYSPEPRPTGAKDRRTDCRDEGARVRGSESERGGFAGGVAYDSATGLEGAAGARVCGGAHGLASGGIDDLLGGLGDDDDARPQGRLVGRHSPGEWAAWAAGLDDFWKCDWLWCRDEKWRAVEPGTFPLAHGASSRVGRIRAYGNAIVAQQAAQFVLAAFDALRILGEEA